MNARYLYPARKAPGFTLVELMVTVAVVAILATIAGPSFRELIANVRVKAASTSLYTAMIQARSAAVQQDTRAVILPKSGDWAQGWEVFVDANRNGARDGGEPQLDDQGPLNGVTVQSGPASIAFRGSGRLATSFTEFTIVNEGTPCIVKRLISADASGRPYVKEGACS